MTDSIARLHEAVLSVRSRKGGWSRTAKLARDGASQMAKKLAEEAVEVGLDAVQGRREAVVGESADLLYHLVVLWTELGVTPDDVWAEMNRRERLLGIAEKLPKGPRRRRALIRSVVTAMGRLRR